MLRLIKRNNNQFCYTITTPLNVFVVYVEHNGTKDPNILMVIVNQLEIKKFIAKTLCEVYIYLA